MIPTLPDGFLARPLAHRALHDATRNRPENSLAAVRAAVARGYGIEIDVQLTADDRAVVFHDYALERLTTGTGPVRKRTAAELARIPLRHCNEGIPGLGDVLDTIAGQVPLLIEIKDQDGALGPDVGPLEAAVADALQSYEGPVAVMSYNPHSMLALQTLAPGIPRGLVTETFGPDWPVPAETRERLSEIPDFERVGACFISHDHRQLAAPRVAELKEQGATIICWTVRTHDEERAARRIADAVTFEGYLA